MDRAPRRDDRPYRRDDDRRDQRASRNDRDRSRSPVRREQNRDDRRRERSPPSRSSHNGPPRGGAPRRGGDDSRAPDPRRAAGSRSPPAPSTRDRRAGDAVPRASRPGAGPQANGASDRGSRQQQQQRQQEAPADEDEEAAMQRLMGFATFRTTKNTKVPGNERNYAVAKVKKTEYRQYMNRLGGFNRALSPSR